MIEKEIFPLADVEAALADRNLQRRYRYDKLDPGERAHLDQARTEAIEAGAPESSAWIYFRSPPITWERECGREGWMLYDAESRTQHAFIWTTMS